LPAGFLWVDNNKDIPMTKEEQLKRKVKQQKTLIVSLLALLASTTLIFWLNIASSWESRAFDRKLQQMGAQVEQLKNDFQKIEEALESKKQQEQQDETVE